MFIDIHVHSTQRGGGPCRPNGETYATPEQLIARFEELEIDRAVLLPSIHVECGHHPLSVDGCLEIAERHPDRFIPFCNIDPRMLTYSPKADFAPMLEFYKAQGCKGVGELTANLPFDDAMVWNLFGHIEAAGLPATFHMSTRIGGTYGLYDELGLPRLEETLRRFPKLTFLGHSQAFWSHISGDVTEATRGGYPKEPVAEGGTVVRLMREYPNLCGDLSAGSGYNAVSRDPGFGYGFLEEFQGRLFFGTDIASPTTPAPLVGFLRQAVDGGHISRQAFEQIAWKNAARLLGL
jgi:predicted TIM-barrel fold metal-dependent hydrolase